jgi:hypothetical protein
MAKFIILYNGEATDMSDMSPEQMESVRQKWEEWMGNLGDALLDVGTPLANGTAIVDNGSDGEATALSGYSIIEADNMEGARKLVANHPFLSDDDGLFKVEIHEMMPVPMSLDEK